MLNLNKSSEETHYDVLSVKEDASLEEIRASYRSAILTHHPDKVQNWKLPTSAENESGDGFLKVQKAWEVLGDVRSRAVYDSQLRASRQDTGIIAEDVVLEDMTVEDNGETLELSYQCRCGDFYSVDSSDLEKIGYPMSREGSKMKMELPYAQPGSVVLPCGSCSLRIRLLLNTDFE